jgi:pSer/pThr/pTyr-binding forkhead associated (FHA) protein
MDDPKLPGEGNPLPLQGPHWKHSDLEPAQSLPLRLVLQPGGDVAEVNRSDMIVGRHSESDVRLRSPEVSRRHCRFIFTGGQWQVFDLNSLNGVWVNGLRVQQAVLQNKDVIHIGSYDFEVEIGPVTLPLSHLSQSSADKQPQSTPQIVPPHSAGSEERKAS